MHPSTEKVEVSAFDAARIKALNAYALIEMSLGWLLSAIIGVNLLVGTTIIFKLTNTRSRYAIISDLLSKTANAECRPFWNGLERRLGNLDGTRNQIVHWVSVFDHGVVGGPNPTPPEEKQISMQPGARLGPAEESDLTLDDLKEFAHDASQFHIILNMFAIYLEGRFADQKRETLRQIFLRPPTDQTLAELHSLHFSKDI